MAQVETVGLGALCRATLACRFGAGALGFISACASSGGAALAATTGAGGAGGGVSATADDGGVMVGTEVSKTIRSGHLRADWMRSIMLLAGPCCDPTAAACLTGADASGALLGQIQPATNSNAIRALPTQMKYRPSGTTYPPFAFANPVTNKLAP